MNHATKIMNRAMAFHHTTIKIMDNATKILNRAVPDYGGCHQNNDGCH